MKKGTGLIERQLLKGLLTGRSGICDAPGVGLTGPLKMVSQYSHVRFRGEFKYVCDLSMALRPTGGAEFGVERVANEAVRELVGSLVGFTEKGRADCFI